MRYLLKAPRIVWAVVVVLLVMAALGAPFNHDETQYYAANAVGSRAAPYREFAYLQTPLGLYVGRWLLALTPGYALLSGRIIQALAGVAIAVIVWKTALRILPRRAEALRSALLMMSCFPFLFCVTVYRNDVLPCLLEVMAMASLLRMIDSEGRVPRVAIALSGLLIALAGAAKINFLLLGGAPLIWLAMQEGVPWRRKAVDLAVLATGAGLGLCVIAYPLLHDPDAFMWQVVTFNGLAPGYWLPLIGEGVRLTIAGRSFDAIVILLEGPMLCALALIALYGRWQPDGEGSAPATSAVQMRAVTRLVTLFLVFALGAAIIPIPSWKQYFIVILPPLFLRLGFVMCALEGRVRKVVIGALGIFALAGVSIMVVRLVGTLSHPEKSIVTHWQESRWIGETLRAKGVRGEIATLSPHLTIDSGYTPDLRFTAGPFIFRWADPARIEQIKAVGAVTSLNVDAAFAKRPPAAIVTGYEKGDGKHQASDLDRHLSDYATRQGYQAVASPFGAATLYVRPAAVRGYSPR